MTGLIFGNSHVGALRLGYQEESAEGYDFYAIPGGGGPAMRAENGRLLPAGVRARPRTSIADAAEGGLDLSPYDHVVYASLGLGAVREKFDHVAKCMALSGYEAASDDTATQVSSAVFGAVVAQATQQLASLKTLRKIVSVYAGPVICVPVPVPVTSMVSDNSPLLSLYGDRLPTFMAAYYTRQLAVLRQEVGALRANVTLLGEPDADWVARGATPPEFIVKMGDPWHMNAEYGKRVLAQIRQALGK